MEVKLHTRFGRCAFATRTFAPGDAVISELPLLMTRDPTKPLSDRQQLFHNAVIRPDDDKAVMRDGSRPGSRMLRINLERFLAWGEAPTEKQRRALDTLQHSAEHREGACAVACEWAATAIADRLLPLAPGLLPAHFCPAGAPRSEKCSIIERVLLTWEINAHEVDNRSALFEHGSMLTHTCGAANTMYQFHNGKGYHVALTHIAPGQLLTTSYLNPLDTMMPTPLRRRRLLRGFAFRCRCDRCEAAQDDMRDIPCPRCVPRGDDGKLPTEVATGAASPSGVLRLHAAAAAAATTHARAGSQPGILPTGQPSTSNTARPGPTSPPPVYQCRACSLIVPSEDSAALFNPLRNTDAAVAGVRGPGRTQPLNLDGMTDLEGVLCDAVWHYWFYVSSYNEYEWGKVFGLVAAAGRWLGPCHYATTLARLVRVEVALKKLEQCLMSLLGTGPRAEFARVGELLELVEGDWRHVWRWLTTRTSLQQLHPGYPVFERLVTDARALGAYGEVLDMAAAAAVVPGPAAGDAAAQARHMAALLLGWVEPVMRQHLRVWRTPFAHPMVKVEVELRRQLGMP